MQFPPDKTEHTTVIHRIVVEHWLRRENPIKRLVKSCKRSHPCMCVCVCVNRRPVGTILVSITTKNTSILLFSFIDFDL